MVTLPATVTNALGIHCRPSLLIAREASGYAGSIRITAPGGTASAKSVLELMSLAICCHQTISITVEGPDEESVARRFVKRFEDPFDFTR